MAFWIPAGLSVVVLGLMLINHPGAWYVVLLFSVLQVVFICAVFAAPTLLLGGYDVLVLNRRLSSDAARRWPIVRARADVAWSRRRRGLVAEAGGRRLASPFFTALSYLPTYWDHFDHLAPGSYDVELLEESGLVLSAKLVPAAHDKSSDEHAGNVALRAAFRSSLDDLQMNRRGRASPAQRWHLLITHAWLLPALAAFGTGTALAARALLATPHLGGIFGALVAAALSAFLINLAGRVALDVAHGALDSRAGLVRLTPHKDNESGSVGGMEFTTSHGRARALQPGTAYRVYVFRRSRQAVSAELA